MQFVKAQTMTIPSTKVLGRNIIVNVITGPVMKLEHPKDLSFFYECRTFLHKKILNGYVRVLDLSSFLPPLLNNVGLKHK